MCTQPTQTIQPLAVGRPQIAGTQPGRTAVFLPEETPPELGVMVIRRIASRRPSGLANSWPSRGSPGSTITRPMPRQGPHRRFASLASMPSDSC